MVRTKNSVPKCRGFESSPGHVVISLGKIFTMIFLGWSGVIVPGCGKKERYLLSTTYVTAHQMSKSPK